MKLMFAKLIGAFLETRGYHSTAKMEFEVEQAAKAATSASEKDWLQLMQLGGPQLRAAINSALAAVATLESELCDANDALGAAERVLEEAKLQYELAETRYGIASGALGPLRKLQVYGDDMDTIVRQAPVALTGADLVIERSA